MKHLISMTDFVLSKKYTATGHENYANFLKQPLELWMFVPCDDNGNVLKEPDADYYMMITRNEISKYQQAKERCLFEGFSEKDARFSLFANETIEDLIEYNLQLTKTAEKQIGL